MPNFGQGASAGRTPRPDRGWQKARSGHESAGAALSDATGDRENAEAGDSTVHTSQLSADWRDVNLPRGLTNRRALRAKVSLYQAWGAVLPGEPAPQAGVTPPLWDSSDPLSSIPCQETIRVR
jgi:hypothetical protein